MLGQWFNKLKIDGRYRFFGLSLGPALVTTGFDSTCIAWFELVN